MNWVEPPLNTEDRELAEALAEMDKQWPGDPPMTKHPEYDRWRQRAAAWAWTYGERLMAAAIASAPPAVVAEAMRAHPRFRARAESEP